MAKLLTQFKTLRNLRIVHRPLHTSLLRFCVGLRGGDVRLPLPANFVAQGPLGGSPLLYRQDLGIRTLGAGGAMLCTKLI